jgi:NUMOD4 motif/HNH endonuclease
MRHGKSHSVLEWLPSQKKLVRVAVQKHQCNDGNAEMWADIRGYEGRYQVSTLGRVKSLARARRGKAGADVPMPERIMSLTPKKDTGRTKPYVEVRFRNGGLRTERCKSFLVHRLVADAFIKRLEPGEQVDHINGVHGDNRAENLRVMKTVEHARLHPNVVNPLAHDPKTGCFLPRSA